MKPERGKLAALPLLLVLIPAVLSSTHFTPTDNYLVNCGPATPAPITHLDNRIFLPDYSVPNLHLHAPNSSPLIYDPIFNNASSSRSSIYHSARVFQTTSSYKFKISQPGTTHIIRLHFRPSPDLHFQVSANDFLLISNGIPSSPDLYPDPVIKEYFIRVESDQLEIRFTPNNSADVSGYAYVNAIEVISAPKDLIADTAQIVRSGENGARFEGLTKMGLETVYRVNVGGPKVTPFNDSLWRTWMPDDEFLRTDDVRVRKVYTSGMIKYKAGGASREVAPDFVYNTGRVIGGEKSVVVPDMNVTWSFPLAQGDSGYDYLVRLHFCDIASMASWMLFFNVYVNGYLAIENLDLTRITFGSLASPFYADFVVKGCGGLGKLSVSVGPSSFSRVRNIDAILNGVEIMKISNAVKSLDGEFGVDWNNKGSGKGGFCGVLPMVVVVCLLVLLSIGIKHRLATIKDSGIWTRLSAISGSDSGVKYSNIPMAEKV